jgi:hypothetical protein
MERRGGPDFGPGLNRAANAQAGVCIAYDVISDVMATLSVPILEAHQTVQ